MAKKIKLVLSGSGTKFPVFAGAIKRLEQEGYIVEEVIGTSGGSIVAAALASGMKSNEIIKLCREILPNLSKLVDKSLINFLTNFGFIKGDKIEKLFEEKFKKTFGETVIPLHVVTSNFDYERKEIFSSKTTPEKTISKICRASMAIPAVFEPVAINGDLHIDGGVYANFAIDYFKDSGNVIGLYFKTSDKKTRGLRPKGFLKIFSFLSRVIDMLIAAKTEDDIEDTKLAKKIPLSTTVGGLDFSFTDEEVVNMIREGYDQVDAWLKQ